MDIQPDVLEKYGPLGAVVILVSLFLSHNAVQGAAFRRALKEITDVLTKIHGTLRVIESAATTKNPSRLPPRDHPPGET